MDWCPFHLLGHHQRDRRIRPSLSGRLSSSAAGVDCAPFAMALRNRVRAGRAPESTDVPTRPTPAPGAWPTVDLRWLFWFLIAFRVINALTLRTFFQPDEHYQTTEIAHRLVFGYGFKSWEWSNSNAATAASHTSYLAAAARNLLDGPVRSILHPLLFVPGYAALRLMRLDQTRLLVVFPRLQQALVAAIGDVYTFRLAYRVGGQKVAWLATLVGLSNLYALYTATRTFSNSTEAAITAAALFYWPFVPFFSNRFDVFTFATAQERIQLLELKNAGRALRPLAPQSTKEEPCHELTPYDRDLDHTQLARAVYDRALRKSLCLAAMACLLRPTNGVLWLYLVAELFASQLRCLQSRADGQATTSNPARPQEADNRPELQPGSVLPMLQAIGEAGSLLRLAAAIGLASVGIALAVDTTYDYMAHQASRGAQLLPALSLVSFVHKNVVANLSLFYGANAWHWYLTQGIPVLCTVWLPATLFGLADALLTHNTAVGAAARRSLARLVCVTVAVYSLLGHKEFRFLQPLLPALTVLAGSGLATSYAGDERRSRSSAQEAPVQHVGPLRHLWRSMHLLPLWLRTVLLAVQPMLAIYLNTMHAVAQEQVAFELGRIYRQQQRQAWRNDEAEFGAGFGHIHQLGFLMPCHSTPWATHLHDRQLVQRSWFLHCPPPPPRSAMTPAQAEVAYWDQTDFFYHDPIKYLVERFPYNVDPRFPETPDVAGYAGGGAAEHPWDQGWRHSWPSHLVVFESLLHEGTRKVGHTRTLKNLLSLKGYREVARYWNTPKHEDRRRDGDVVVLAYKGPKIHR